MAHYVLRQNDWRQHVQTGFGVDYKHVHPHFNILTTKLRQEHKYTDILGRLWKQAIETTGE
jgi:hypothetical protein